MTTALAIAREFLPSLVEKLRGRGGRAVAETVVDAAAAAAGVSSATQADQMIARLRRDAGAAEELRRELQMIDREVYMSELDDRERARQHQRASAPAERARGNWMIIGVFAGLVACVAGSIWGVQQGDGGRNLDPGVLALVTTVAGAMLKMLSDAFAFEFGSSRASREKDLVLADQTQQLASSIERDKRTAIEALRETRAQIPAVAERVAKVANEAVLTGAAAVTAAVDAVKPRDFVGQLVRGEI
jgi:hypothetical protein